MSVPWKPQPRVKAAHGVTSLSVPVPPISRHDFASAPVALPPGRKKWSLTAASEPIKPKNEPKGIEAKYNQTAEWQREAWAMMWQVPELRYAMNLYANGMSRLILKPAKELPNGTRIELTDIREEDLTDNDRIALKAHRDFFRSQSQAQMLKQFGAAQFTAGESVLVGLPERRRGKNLTGYEWRVYSKRDVRYDENNADLVFICDEPYNVNSIMPVRQWTPDPEFYKLATSPVRGCLPVLRLMVGLAMYVSAQIDSRLAGAGILLLPNSMTALGASAPEDNDVEDPAVAELINAMLTAIRDRDSAASLVPVIMTGPDDSLPLIRHLTFASELDNTAGEQLDRLIRRLALGLDMNAETLLGGSDSSHWAQYWSDEGNVRNQLIPCAELFTQSMDRDYFQPVLEELGLTEEEASEYVTNIDSSELVYRPNNFEESLQMWKVGLLTDAALLNSGGYDLSDAPPVPEETDQAVEMVKRAVAVNPSLYESPGLMNMVSQARALLDGHDQSTAPEDALPPDQNNPAGGDDPAYDAAQGESERGRTSDTGKVQAPPREGTADGRRPRAEGPASDRTSDQRK